MVKVKLIHLLWTNEKTIDGPCCTICEEIETDGDENDNHDLGPML